MSSVETQTSDQRIILTKALLVAQTRAKEFQEALDSYDALLVEAVIDALRKVENAEFVDELCEAVGFPKDLEGDVTGAAAAAAAPTSEPLPDASPESVAARERDRARLLRQLDLLQVSSRRWLEAQRMSAGSAALSAPGTPESAMAALPHAHTPPPPPPPPPLSPRAASAPVTPLLALTPAPGLSALSIGGPAEGLRYTRHMLGLAARAALAQRRAEIESGRARAAEQRVQELETRLAAALAASRERAAPLATVSSAPKQHRFRAVAAVGSHGVTVIQRALSYLSSLCGWLVDLCSQLTARVVRTLVA